MKNVLYFLRIQFKYPERLFTRRIEFVFMTIITLTSKVFLQYCETAIIGTICTPFPQTYKLSMFVNHISTACIVPIRVLQLSCDLYKTTYHTHTYYIHLCRMRLLISKMKIRVY